MMQHNQTLVQMLGQNIRTMREARKLTREKLVDLIGDQNISVATIARLEHGQTGVKIEHLKRIATALNVNMIELLFPDGARTIVIKELRNTGEDPKSEEFFLDMQKLFYPDLHCEGALGWQKFPIRTLAQFIIYLPLINPVYLADVLCRICGDTFNYEYYLLQQMEFLYSTIPDGKAKRFADYMTRKMSFEEYVRYHTDSVQEDDQEYVYGKTERMEMAEDYMRIVKEYSRILTSIWNTVECTLIATQEQTDQRSTSG